MSGSLSLSRSLDDLRESRAGAPRGEPLERRGGVFECVSGARLCAPTVFTHLEDGPFTITRRAEIQEWCGAAVAAARERRRIGRERRRRVSIYRRSEQWISKTWPRQSSASFSFIEFAFPFLGSPYLSLSCCWLPCSVFLARFLSLSLFLSLLLLCLFYAYSGAGSPVFQRCIERSLKVSRGKFPAEGVEIGRINFKEMDFEVWIFRSPPARTGICGIFIKP